MKIHNSAGIKAENCCDTIGGTESGSLISTCFFLQNKNIPPTINPMMIAINIPEEPNQENGNEAEIPAAISCAV